ncbi:hypothetical protein H7X46_16250 [Pseudonocardia sp. C8]|uniref:hypothetical protein n=1 Tax=Pseudonocardia sp. C8 TaxID=2762759 RepID=UPI0016426967|nr:hypothetical protein [Pseudonocardia sp. C8]MBC3192617.1 hypothetical protein [Pseudonocardia sp. C8]
MLAAPGTAEPPSTGRAGPGPSRVGLHVLLAGLPLLSISAHVFGLMSMKLSAAVLVIPLAAVTATLTVFAPHPADRVLAHGLGWGVVACAVYDVFRLDTVYLLGLWGDFIPTMGTWITGHPDGLGGAVVGYLWRYLGDGGGIGMTFFVVASICGLHRRSRARVVLVAVGFAVVPVWAGLIGTVALAARGEELMFPLTPTTVTLSLIGHLIFGVVLGLGFWRSRAVQAHWPWEPLRPPRFREVIPAAAAPRGSSTAAAPVTASPAVVPAVPRAVSPAAVVDAVPPAPATVLPGGDASGPVRMPRQRTSSTPPAARTLDPDTWARWQRRLETAEPGRRAHAGGPSGRPGAVLREYPAPRAR